MSAIAPPPKAPPPLIFKVLVGILFLCTLVALWVAGARVKASKIAARQGEKISLETPPPPPSPRLRVLPATPLDEYFAKASAAETVDVEIDPACPPSRQDDIVRAASARGIDVRFRVPDTGVARLTLRPRERLRVEHVSLTFQDGGILVEDSKRKPLAEFPAVKKGQIRRWQEFQITIADAAAESLSIGVDLKPGEPCFGLGRYRARQGLQILFDGGRSVTISVLDPAQGGMTVRVEGPGGPVDRTIEVDAAVRIQSLTLTLRRQADREPVLSIDEE